MTDNTLSPEVRDAAAEIQSKWTPATRRRRDARPDVKPPVDLANSVVSFRDLFGEPDCEPEVVY